MKLMNLLNLFYRRSIGKCKLVICLDSRDVYFSFYVAAMLLLFHVHSFFFFTCSFLLGSSLMLNLFTLTLHSGNFKFIVLECLSFISRD